MIDLARTGDPEILRLLARHPKVAKTEESHGKHLWFKQGAWEREVAQGVFSIELYGLVEMMDNNPLVCADRVSIPTPVGTLAAVALGPLIDAGLLSDSPTILASMPDDRDAVDRLLAKMGWTDGAVMDAEEKDLEGVVAAMIIAAIQTPERLEDLDDLYEERFGRSFFVRRSESDAWDIELAKGSQNAYFRLRVSPGDEQSLLTIQAMADLQGKCGPGAMVHAMNVMAGLEESLGLEAGI